MRILTFTLCLFLLISNGYATWENTKEGYVEEGYTKTGTSKGISDEDNNKIQMADAAMSKLKIRRDEVKSGKLDCFNDCLSKQSCGQRPSNPSSWSDTYRSAEVIQWATCVLAEVDSCKASCK